MADDKQDRCNLARRSCIGAIMAAALQPLSSSAHTPYKQWAVYRQKHLLVGCHKDDPETYELSKKIVALLEIELPTASARVARAPAATRLASLLATDQLNVAIVAPETAVAMQSGAGIFAAYGSISLGTLLPIGNKVLIGHERLHDNHSWQITKALQSMTTVDVKTVSPALPWHNGSHQYVLGKPKPDKH